MRIAAVLATLSVSSCPWFANVQEQPNAKPLLPHSAVEAIVNQVSGAVAYGHLTHRLFMLCSEHSAAAISSQD